MSETQEDKVQDEQIKVKVRTADRLRAERARRELAAGGTERWTYDRIIAALLDEADQNPED